jgi:nucleotide-binding universal stress UspA family protein
MLLTRVTVMSIKDILFPLTSYPSPTAPAAIESALNLVKPLAAHLCAMVNEMEVSAQIGVVLKLQDIDSIVETVFARSRKLAQDVVANFEKAAREADVPHSTIVAHCMPADYPGRAVGEARLRDISMLAMGKEGVEQGIAEALLFESGRPVLLFPGEATRELAHSVDKIALAWDYSGPAARAVADAFPLLERARTVRIFTVVDDKELDVPKGSMSLQDRLAKRGIKAVSDEVKSDGSSIGRVFADYLSGHGIDLLVMGAYGHSRFREFVLGGATRSMIQAPPTWTLMAH